MRKSSAKTRSDSSCGDGSPNICSGASSYRNFEAGPYGDIPQEVNGQYFKDYMIFMLQESECSTGTSDYSDHDDQELYNLRNEYIQKLNLVRRRLNLSEISGDRENQEEKGCTITEIIEEDDNQNTSERGDYSKHLETTQSSSKLDHSPKKSGKPHTPPTKGSATKANVQQKFSQSAELPEKPKSTEEPPEKLEPKQLKQRTPELKQFKSQYARLPSTSSNNSENVEIQTLYPFSLCYNKINAQSITNLLELEYNPPKKKSCYRLLTPKLPSASESYIPYHTKVSLHEGLFKGKRSRENTAADKKPSARLRETFTVTREIQCDECELEDRKKQKNVDKLKSEKSSTNLVSRINLDLSSQSRTDSSGSPTNHNLYPEVIVKYHSPREVVLSSRCSTSGSSNVEKKWPNSHHPNFVPDNLQGGDHTVYSTTTVPKEKKKKNLEDQETNAEDFWSQMRDGEVDAVLKKKKASNTIKKSLVQYITYRKGKKRPKTTPIKTNAPVPFGPVILQGCDRVQNVDSKFYFFDSSSSEDGKCLKQLYVDKIESPNSNAVREKKSFRRLFSCFESLMSLFNCKKRHSR